ncbi:polysaccharide biosynthesis/export family protein [Albidovulum inexpectatum]|uniref:polysaccharide biosynthesis/export family protein n=1 Tax=Albidovulum inexpectatum TaxID=196587 RepID=UPI001FE55B5B|nr:polysaccharide biosynthesis/export family protein [Albidovulum inexpectatum]
MPVKVISSKTPVSRMALGTALLAVALGLAGCGLPRSGPTRGELVGTSEENAVPAHVVPVTAEVARITNVRPPLGFSSKFIKAGTIGSDVIMPGDVLGLTVWENVDNGLLAGPGMNATHLQEMQVDGDGYIFVPYAGRIKAAGNTPESLRRVITAKLAEQTPDPQVLVTRVAGDGATVSVVGNVGAQGVYPLERPTRTLAAMLAKAGGVAIEPEIAQVVVKRNGMTERVWLKDLYTDSRYDIALRPGDIILVEKDQRKFTAMGATGAQTLVDFETQELSAIEALAQVGGLSSNRADPTGIFILRIEEPEVARAVLKRSDITTPQRIVYVIDLTQPQAMFNAQEFMIRDKDMVYVTEAPYVQWQKLLSAITGTVRSADTLSTVGN